MALRSIKLIAATAFATMIAGVALAAEKLPYEREAFLAAKQAGEPILVEIHATWCPTCKAQAPILAELEAQPKFRKLKVFHVDFDDQKPAVHSFQARMQSTLITFKGGKEQARSVGDTNPASIAKLLDSAL